LRGSNCGPPYQVQRQSPLNQLTIGGRKKKRVFKIMVQFKIVLNGLV
jgi:hypothetical protein